MMDKGVDMPDNATDRRTTLRDVIDKMEKTAVDTYDGRFYENIYAIFMELEVPERKIYLRGLANIVLTFKNDVRVDAPRPIVEDAFVPMEIDRAKKPAVEEDKELTDERPLLEIDEYNRKELIRLKSWAAKFVMKVIAIAILGTVALVYTVGDQSKAMETFKFIKEILTTAVGL